MKVKLRKSGSIAAFFWLEQTFTKDKYRSPLTLAVQSGDTLLLVIALRHRPKQRSRSIYCTTAYRQEQTPCQKTQEGAPITDNESLSPND
ncbi:MAG: hypothetical protein AB1589_26200 [Cyanobacteriota bacterium]